MEIEHARLEAEIERRLHALGRTSHQLDMQVERMWETSCRWRDLSIRYKQKLIKFLDMMAVAEESF